MDLILVHRVVELESVVQAHGRRADVILAGVVVVALVVRVVVVRGDRDRRGWSWSPGTVVIARTTATCPAAGEDVSVVGSARYQGQRRRRRSVARVHGNAVRRIGVLLALRRQHCKFEMRLQRPIRCRIETG